MTYTEADNIVRDLRKSGAGREALLSFIRELLVESGDDSDEAVFSAWQFSAHGPLHGLLDRTKAGLT